jgi:hypothetical protein
MLDPVSRWIPIVVLGAAAVLGACGSSNGGGDGGFDTTSASSGSSTQSSMNGGGGAGGISTFVGSSGTSSMNGGGGNNSNDLEVTPKDLQTISVKVGAQTPNVIYKATLNGSPISAGWTVDRGEIGVMPTTPQASADFTPTGNVGGYVNVTAGLKEGGKTMSVVRQILVKLTSTQNGSNMSPKELAQIPGTVADLTAGGGVGGVGGEGLGGAVDAGTQTKLGSPADDGSALGLTMLYPYDKTVFPRGILAPLVMWDWQTGDADAIQMKLSTKSGSFTYTGTFSAPAILMQTGGKFIRMPIPEDAWEEATNSAGGSLPDGSADTLKFELTVLKDNVAHGPFVQTWTIAPARLSGIIYYNSYGTQLAKNLGGALGGDKMFGGAVLSIHVGDTKPNLVAGGNGDATQCRVCHSVAADGSRLVAQWGSSGDVPSSDYDLAVGGVTEHLLANSTTFPAIYPDGSKELAADGTLYPLPDNTTALATPAASGLSAIAGNLGSPAFSPDGKLLAVNAMSGTNQTLTILNFDPTTYKVTNPVVVVDDTASPAATRPGWPAFFPDGSSVVFHQQSVAGADGNGSGTMYTRKGAKAQLAWTSATDKTHVTALNALNGFNADGMTSYLPKLAAPVILKTAAGGTCNPATPNAACCKGDGVVVDSINPAHDDDVDLNYEPTVNPLASGGYAWVVFTSRRMYGSVADIPPYCSDPRGVDLIQNITPKKLWVAAIDLNGHPATDASHPGFYLPAQELLAGNSRGFWVLDPCKADGSTCDTGDQCCNGFCEPGQGGALVCSNMPNNGSCSGTSEHCDKTSDCCDSADKCVGGFCSQSIPR